jgi:hypothetical protein
MRVVDSFADGTRRSALQALWMSRWASVADYRVMGDGIYRGIGRCMLEMWPAALHFECVIDHFRCELMSTVLELELLVRTAADFNKAMESPLDAGASLKLDASDPRCGSARDVVGSCSLRVLQGRLELAGLIAAVQIVGHW